MVDEKKYYEALDCCRNIMANQEVVLMVEDGKRLTWEPMLNEFYVNKNSEKERYLTLEYAVENYLTTEE